MKNYLNLINQFFEIKSKIADQSIERNLNKIMAIFNEEGFTIIDPTNEKYAESRTDCEASIVGNISSSMIITKTLKPIIYQNVDGKMQLIQKAIVIVEKK